MTNIRDIVPYLEEFLKFSSNYLTDINIRVVNNMLDMLLILVKRLDTYICGQLKPCIKMLLSVNSDAKIETKVSH